MSGGGRDPLRRRHPDRQPGGRHPAGAARAPRGRSHRRRGHAPHAHAPRAPRQRAPALIERLRAGAAVALVSDAGTPGIADPGYHLVRGALAAGIAVVPVPGPSALTALVSVAGVPAERIVFEGFLPRRPGPRAARLAALAREPRALLFFEAARRL